jgi:transposase-like protein
MPHVNIAIRHYVASIAHIACPICKGALTLTDHRPALNFGLRRFECERCEQAGTTDFETRAEGWLASTELRPPT